MRIDHEAANLPTALPSFAERPLLQRLSVADGLLVLLIGMAAILRWGWLGMLPLAPEEAREALAVFYFSHGSAEMAIGSPAYFTLSTLQQLFVIATDASVRFVPTLFSLGTLALPWLLRARIGTVGALVTALLLAVSPVHQALGRTAGGDAIAVFAGLLLFVGWMRWLEAQGDNSAENRALIMVSIAGALGLSSSPLFYSFLDTLLVLWILTRLLGPRINTPQPTRAQWQSAAIVGAVCFFGVSTLFFWQPAGIGAATNLFAAWIAQFALGAGFLTPWLALLRYETLPLLLGLVFTAWLLLRDRHPLTRWLVYWLFGSIALILIQAGNLTNLALLTIPLYLLIGVGYHRLLALDQKTALLTLIVSAWGGVLMVAVGRYLKLPPQNVAPLLIAFILLMAVGLLIIAVLPTTRQIAQSVALSALLFSVYLGWGSGWSLTHHTGNDPRELWVSSGTDADLRLLRDTLHEGSYQLSRARRALSVVSTVDTPALRWYLREFDDVSFAETVERESNQDAILTPATAQPTLQGAYARTDFDAAVVGATETPFSLSESLKWWFFRQSSAELTVERISLWLRIEEE